MGEAVDSHPLLDAGRRGAKVLRVTEVGEEILRRPCAAVTDFGSPELSRLIDDMFITMYVSDGAGLAANQVDLDLRLFVYDCPDDGGIRHVGYLCNPVLDPPAGRQGRELIERVEACLSVPGGYHDVPRDARTVVRGQDMDGKPVVIEGTGYFARCLQHETDHLNGLLYIDRLTGRQRRNALHRMDQGRDAVLAERAAKTAALHS